MKNSRGWVWMRTGFERDPQQGSRRCGDEVSRGRQANRNSRPCRRKPAKYDRQRTKPSDQPSRQQASNAPPPPPQPITNPDQQQAFGTPPPPVAPTTPAASSSTGVPIRLGSIANVSVGRGPSEVRRIRSQRAAVVSANLSGRDLTTVSDEIRRESSSFERSCRPKLPSNSADKTRS